MRIPPALPVAVLLLTGTCAPAPGREPDGAAAEILRDASGAGVHEPHGIGEGDGHERHAAPPAPGRPSGRSIYHLPGEWTDQDGRATTLAGLGGRVQVVAMVYTNCTFACPRILARMKAIEGRLSADARDDVGFVLVSIDPERDTPDRLRRFADDTRLDTDRWTLLNGADADVLALSVLLGVKYRATGDGEYAHSNVLTVLDRDGEIVGRSEGLNADPTPVLEAVAGVL